MSSDPFIFDSDLHFMASDLLLPFIDSPDILLHDPVDQLSAAADYSLLLRPSSPPCHQLESLSLCQAVSSELPCVLQDCPGCGSGGGQEGTVKGQGSPVGYETFVGPHSYGGPESSGISNAVRHYMQRSYSSNLFEEKTAAALYQPQFDAVVDSGEFQGRRMVSSPEGCFLGAQLRRVFSTGDLQRTSMTMSSPSGPENSFVDEANLKAGRYSPEERKERILKYRAKRTQRNFTKTIKYACRKTLADNRPRVRGRFARNDEIGEPPRAPSATARADDLWVEKVFSGAGLHEEEYAAGSASVPYLEDNYGQTRFHYSYDRHY